MTSPQEEYSHDELKHYLEAAETALANHKAKYPNLSFEYIHSPNDVLATLRRYVTEYSTQILEDGAYLDEIDYATPVGSIIPWDKKAKHKKLLKRIGLQKAAFENELDNLIILNELQLRALYLELSQLTVPVTTYHMDEMIRREEWLDKQRHYYELYHIKQCRCYSPLKDVELTYISLPSNAPAASGVYCLFKDGEALYFGHSTNLRQRLKNHSVVRNSYLQNEDGEYDIDCVVAEAPIKEAKSIERKLISIARPTLNKKGNGK